MEKVETSIDMAKEFLANANQRRKCLVKGLVETKNWPIWSTLTYWISLDLCN